MRIQLEKDYKSGDVLEVSDPHDSAKKLRIQLPQDYEANAWVEVCLRILTFITS